MGGNDKNISPTYLLNKMGRYQGKNRYVPYKKILL